MPGSFRSRGFPALPAACLLGALFHVSALPQEVDKHLIERPADVVIEKVGLASSSDASGGLLRKAAFSAFGRRYELGLQSNDRIKSGLDAELLARVSDVRLYRGGIEDDPGSWARLAERDGRVTGVFWDGIHLYVVEISADRSRIYRAEEALAGIGMSLAGDHGQAVTADTNLGTTGTSSFIAGSGLPIDPGRTIRVGVVADSPVVAERAADTEADLLEIMNVVDGIFLWQLGVRVDVAEIVLLDAATDPFSATESEEFLAALAELKGSSSALGSLGLLHLFTGRNIVYSSSQDDPLGVANLGTVCDTRSAVSITEFRGGDGLVLEYLVAAHELAHNLGAPHDNEAGSVCASTPGGFLMENAVNGSETFSQCSIDQMAPYVLGGSCFAEWLPNDLSLRFVNGPDVIQYRDDDRILVAIDTNGQVTGNVVELFVEASGAIELGLVSEWSNSDIGFECNSRVYPRYCHASYVPQGSTAEFEINAKAAEIGSGNVTVTVRGGNDPNPDNDVLVHAITVPPAVDLMSSIEVLPGQSEIADEDVVYAGTRASLSASVTNLSAEPAGNVTAEFRFNSQSSEYQLGTPGGTCGLGALSGWLVCELGTLSGGEQRAFDVSFKTRDDVGGLSGSTRESVKVSVASDEFDFDARNNAATASITVVDSIFELVPDVSYTSPVEVGTPGSIVYSIENLGPDAAKSVRLATTHRLTAAEAGLEFSVTTSTGDCALNPNAGYLTCEYGTLDAGKRIETTVEFVGSKDATLRVLPGWGAVGYQVGGWRPTTSFDLVVVEDDQPQPPPDPDPDPDPDPTPDPGPTPEPEPAPSPPGSGGSGGGGSMDWLTFTLLLLASAIGPGQRQSCCAKNARVSVMTSPDNSSSPTRFGSAMRPFMMSANVQTSSSSVTAPMNMTSTNARR